MVSLSIRIDRCRARLASHLETILAAPESALAIALITGDKSLIPQTTIEAILDTGLAHILAISGLHVGLMATLTFVLVRFTLAAIQPIALRTDIEKWAASAALCTSFTYLLISGATLPTQRAFCDWGQWLYAQYCPAERHFTKPSGHVGFDNLDNTA